MEDEVWEGTVKVTANLESVYEFGEHAASSAVNAHDAQKEATENLFEDIQEMATKRPKDLWAWITANLEVEVVPF